LFFNQYDSTDLTKYAIHEHTDISGEYFKQTHFLVRTCSTLQ